MADLNFAARWPAPLFSANNMSSSDFIKAHVNLNVRGYIYLDLGLYTFKTFSDFYLQKSYCMLLFINPKR